MTVHVEDDPRNIPAMMADLNRNLPVRRRTLIDYLERGELTFTTRSGESIPFSAGELDALAAICSDQEKLTLRLPIFIATDPSSERGNWKVEGTTEVAVVARLLRRAVHRPDYLPLYHPDLKTLRDLLPGLTFVLFSP
ncbi:MAG: DUF61 family protein [Candidatus Methanomethylophilus sp.]|nr:DUF61 family protein [Methanomethylophilus sp.]MDD4221656.1 DUF61 family protein [Methanomethylophilus sp.]MDD4668296.1 DUF61 family protein [Methanomethylophilus sp.]